MSNQNHFYTYVYLDPRKAGNFIYQRGIDEVYCFNFEPFYIGKGCKDRINYHLKCYDFDTSYHKKNTIKKIRKVGLEPIIIKVLQNVSENESFAEEINLISVVGRVDKNRGPLTNKTDGGEGVSGRISRKDLSGYVYGRYTILSFSHKDKNGKSKWFCECECGTEKIVDGYHLKSGATQSCGCLHMESKISHGLWGTPIYNIWHGMKQRCRTKNYEQTNENEIKLHENWSTFEGFYKDMGDKPSNKHILKRIKEDGNYEPSNCVWRIR